jgi:hypothetical protein
MAGNAGLEDFLAVNRYIRGVQLTTGETQSSGQQKQSTEND